MSNKILVRLSKDRADEFTVVALWLTTESDFQDFVDRLSKKDISEDTEIYFRTNEWFTFDSLDDILDSLSVSEISEDFYNQFIAILGNSFGMLDIEDLDNYYDDLEDEGESEV